MPNKLETRFWNIASKKASSEGYLFAPDCERYLKDMISDGVKRILAERLDDDEAKIRLAEKHLHQFISLMADEARLRGFSMLREDTFYAAKRSICPLWPFC